MTEWKPQDHLWDCRHQLLFFIKRIENYDMLKASLLPRAIRYTKDRIQRSPEDYFTKTMVKLAVMERNIEYQRARLRRKRMLAYDIIDRIPSVKQRVILFAYFTEEHTNEKSGRPELYNMAHIAEEMGISVNSVKSAFYRGLDKIST